MLVTHDRQLAARCDRTPTLVKGVLQALPAHQVPELSAPIAAAAVLQEYPLPPEQRPALWWWLFAGITLFATMDAAGQMGRAYLSAHGGGPAALPDSNAMAVGGYLFAIRAAGNSNSILACRFCAACIAGDKYVCF